MCDQSLGWDGRTKVLVLLLSLRPYHLFFCKKWHLFVQFAHLFLQNVSGIFAHMPIFAKAHVFGKTLQEFSQNAHLFMQKRGRDFCKSFFANAQLFALKCHAKMSHTSIQKKIRLDHKSKKCVRNFLKRLR